MAEIAAALGWKEKRVENELAKARRALLGDESGEGMLPAAVSDARAMLMIRMPQSELGQFTLTGGPGIFISANSRTPGSFSIFGSAGSLAVEVSPSVLNPDNGAANAKLASDPALRRAQLARDDPLVDGSAHDNASFIP